MLNLWAVILGSTQTKLADITYKIKINFAASILVHRANTALTSKCVTAPLSKPNQLILLK